MLYAIVDAAGFGALVQSGQNLSFLKRAGLLFSVHPGTPDFGGATWFLIVLFIAECICRLITEACSKMHLPNWMDVTLMGAVGLGGAAYVAYAHDTSAYLCFDADLALLACLFISIGIALRRYNVFCIWMVASLLLRLF